MVNIPKNCRPNVKAAVGNAFTDEQVDELVSRVTARFGAKAGKNIDAALIRDALTIETRESLRDALIAQRLKAAGEKAKGFREGLISAMPDTISGKAFTSADKIRAYDVGSDRIGANVGFSTEAEGKARAAHELSLIEAGMEEAGGKDLLDPIFNKAAREAHEDDVAVEIARINGADLPATGNETAAAQARVFAEALERSRLSQNNEGAFINRLPGYVAKQQHDPMKLAGGFWAFGDAAKDKAFQKWYGFIRPLLSDETFADLSDWDFDPDLLKRNGGDREKAFLEKVWMNVTQGAREGQPGSDTEFEFVAPASKARTVSKPRTLHFKEPKAWLSYHREYGKGSLYSVIVSQVEAGARNAALMRRWGPNPEAAREAALKAEISRVRNSQGPEASLTIRRLQDALNGKGQMAVEWDILTGKLGAAHDLRIAAIGNAIRIDQRLSKLGGAVLASLGPDQAVAAQTFKRHGATYLDGYMGAFGGVLRLGKEDQIEAGRLLGIGSRQGIHQLVGRFEAGDGIEGIGAQLTNALFKATGFEFVLEGHRRGVAAMWSAWAARQADTAFDALPDAMRAQMQRFSITAADWDVLRANVQALEDGQRYMKFDGLPPETSLKARAYLQQFIDDSLTEAGVREQAKLTLGTQRGTALGEAVRCFMQFKTFPVTYITRHLNPAVGELMRGEAGAGGKMAHLILSATLFGFVALQAKQLSKGLTPRPVFDEEGNPKGDVWLAALLQGGGLGIYGDFLFGEYNRAGSRGVVETLGGPSVGEFANLTKLMSRMIRVDQYDEDTAGDVAADSVKFLKSNTPFLNLWWSRAAVDHFTLHYIQDQISPGYAERYQKRLKDEQGQEYWFKAAQ